MSIDLKNKSTDKVPFLSLKFHFFHTLAKVKLKKFIYLIMTLKNPTLLNKFQITSEIKVMQANLPGLEIIIE